MRTEVQAKQKVSAENQKQVRQVSERTWTNHSPESSQQAKVPAGNSHKLKWEGTVGWKLSNPFCLSTETSRVVLALIWRGCAGAGH